MVARLLRRGSSACGWGDGVPPRWIGVEGGGKLKKLRELGPLVLGLGGGGGMTPKTHWSFGDPCQEGGGSPQNNRSGALCGPSSSPCWSWTRLPF